MAHPSIPLIKALRETVQRLRGGAHYAWGNHGSCNCGQLLQVVTFLSPGDIVRVAHTGIGEWTELAAEYCGVSGQPVYELLARLQKLGLTPVDIHNLEYLEDREVLESLPGGFRWLKKNVREDVILYFEAFAALLENKLTRLAIAEVLGKPISSKEKMKIPDLFYQMVSVGVITLFLQVW